MEGDSKHFPGEAEGLGLASMDFPTIFPLLIEKIVLIVLIIITGCVSRFANLLKSLSAYYLFVISRSRVRFNRSGVVQRILKCGTSFLGDKIIRDGYNSVTPC